MTRAASVPDETDLLCEGCGYVLTGLAQTTSARCPECGKLLGESAPHLRHPPAWEFDAGLGGRFGAFWRTTADCIFRPARFFRSLSVSEKGGRAARFAELHWLMSAVLFGIAASLHIDMYIGVIRSGPPKGTLSLNLLLPVLFLVAITYLSLDGTTRLVARLTTWEATYRGIRLPLPLVLRGLHYHAAHYLPVSLLAAITVASYQVWLNLAPNVAGLHGTTYLFVLSVEVLLSALYLFKTYWTGMRNLMYASP